MNGTFKVRMIWNETEQKWLMQKYNKILERWVLMYHFWDCGNTISLFELCDKDCKESVHYYELTFKKVKSDGIPRTS